VKLHYIIINKTNQIDTLQAVACSSVAKRPKEKEKE
jgi:hypothetical protein